MSLQRRMVSASIADRRRAYGNICAAILVAAVLSSVSPVAAQEDSCIERSGGVTSEMLDCLAASYETIDGELNLAWSALLSSLDEPQQERLRDAQSIWMQYRDTTCAAEASLQAGSFASVALADCRVRLSIERLHWLQDLHPDPELADLWRSVESAATSHEQEAALSNFLTAAAALSSDPLTYSLSARSVNGAHPVPIEDEALFDQTFEHRLTLSIAGKSYNFRPRSQQAIALLLRE